jgi:hypothetical protein
VAGRAKRARSFANDPLNKAAWHDGCKWASYEKGLYAGNSARPATGRALAIMGRGRFSSNTTAPILPEPWPVSTAAAAALFNGSYAISPVSNAASNRPSHRPERTPPHYEVAQTSRPWRSFFPFCGGSRGWVQGSLSCCACSCPVRSAPAGWFAVGLPVARREASCLSIHYSRSPSRHGVPLWAGRSMGSDSDHGVQFGPRQCGSAHRAKCRCRGGCALILDQSGAPSHHARGRRHGAAGFMGSRQLQSTIGVLSSCLQRCK